MSIALVGSLPARVAVVVSVLRGADDREDNGHRCGAGGFGAGGAARRRRQRPSGGGGRDRTTDATAVCNDRGARSLQDSGCRPAAASAGEGRSRTLGRRSLDSCLHEPNASTRMGDTPPGAVTVSLRQSPREDRRLRQAGAGATPHAHRPGVRSGSTARAKAALNPFDVHAVEEALRLKEGRRRRRGRRRLAGARERARTRCARRSRWGPTARCSSSDDAAAGSDLVATSRCAREGARARGAPTWCSSASRRTTRTAPSSGPRSRIGCGARSISQVAELTVGGRQGARQAPDRVRLRRDRGAASGGRRRLRRDQRAALSVAQGDHGREEEAAGDAHARGRLGGETDASGRPARGPRCSRSATRRRGATPSKIEDDGTAAEKIVEFLAEKRSL